MSLKGKGKLNDPRIKSAIRDHADALKKPGVLDVRAGYKIKDGWVTQTPSIVVTVRNKGQYDAKDALPAEVAGIPVDVRDATTVQKAWADGLPISVRPEHAEPELARLHVPPAGGAKQAVPYAPPANANLGPVTDVMSITCHASPDAGWPTLATFLGKVERTLTVGMYDFTSAHVLKAVSEAMSGGRTLSLVLDHPAPNPSRDQTDDQTETALQQKLAGKLDFAWALERSSPKVRAWIYPTAYHIKVAVRDSHAMWLSSGNWNNSNQPDLGAAGKAAARANSDRDWHVVIEHPGLSATFERFLLNDLAVATKFQNGTGPAEDGVVRAAASAAQAIPEKKAGQPAEEFKPLVITNRRIQVEPLLTPDNFVDHAIGLISSARKTLYIQQQYIHPSQDPKLTALIEAVARKIDAGLDVKIILSQYEATGSWLELIQDAGIELSAVKIQNRVHNKGVIVDSNVVMLGSHNWSGDGVVRNRDASVILHDQDAAKYFQQIFLHDWTNMAKQQLE